MLSDGPDWRVSSGSGMLSIYHYASTLGQVKMSTAFLLVFWKASKMAPKQCSVQFRVLSDSIPTHVAQTAI